MRIDDVFEKFEAYLLTERRVSSHTLVAYKKDIEQFSTYMTQHTLLLDQVTIEYLKDFLGWLVQQNMSPRTRSRKISALKSFYVYASTRYSVKNIAQDLTFPKVEKRLPHCLSEDEIDALLTSVEQDVSPHGLRNKVMIYLLYVTGMRISELVGLTISDIHSDTGLVSVAGKGGKGRMIPLPDVMVTLISTYLTTAHKDFVEKHHTTSYLFPVVYRKAIKPLSRQSVWTILKQLWRKTGSKQTISPHRLRHSFATHMLKRGADLRSLQLLLGHENLSTVQIYTHVETSYLRTIYDKKHPRS